MKILICDDESATDVLENLEASGVDFEPDTRVKKGLTNALKLLFDDVARFLKKPEQAQSSAFGGADLGLFDNNLTHLKTPGSRLTAEHILGYVRAFTSLPYLVSLNKNHDLDFDLDHLVGEDSKADLALNTRHLSNRQLWNGKNAETSFAPWYWPTLLGEPERRTRQIEFVRTHWSEPVMSALHLPVDQDSLHFLSIQARSALYPEIRSTGSEEGKDLEELSFADIFLASDRSLPTADERDQLRGPLEEGVPSVQLLAARLVAADVDLWFRRDLIGPQETLVEVPHLIMRMPFLLGEHVESREAWNAAVTCSEPPFGFDGELFEQYLRPALYGVPEWTTSPCFRWSELKENEPLNELFFESDQDRWPDLVFCEDVSIFLPREQAHQVTVGVEGPWATRYVKKVSGRRYVPLNRLDN